VFNDTYGHQAGDQLLRSATETWRSLLRSSDLLARCGGEEFAVLLPSSTLGEAVEVVDRLRAATPLAQTFSAGVALWHGTETSDQLVARADKALYQAKQAGRNQVLAAEPPRSRPPPHARPRRDGTPGRGRPPIHLILRNPTQPLGPYHRSQWTIVSRGWRAAGRKPVPRV
jgi:Diguanylate cyclase, GGDEF domain